MPSIFSESRLFSVQTNAYNIYLLCMQAIVTVFKNELKDRDELTERLRSLTKDVQDVGDALIYRPHAGGLISFLTVLYENGVTYGTHFNTGEDL
jgi:hypothetical protein